MNFIWIFIRELGIVDKFDWSFGLQILKECLVTVGLNIEGWYLCCCLFFLWFSTLYAIV